MFDHWPIWLMSPLCPTTTGVKEQQQALGNANMLN